MVSIGDRLRGEREALGLTQEKMAIAVGITKKTQGLYERDERVPDAEYLAAVAAKGVDVLYVVTGRRTPEVVSSFNDDEVDLVEHYRQLPDSDRHHARKMVTALAKMTSSDGNHLTE